MESYIPISLKEPTGWGIALLFLSAVITIRYLVICGFAEIVLHRWAPARLLSRRTLSTLPTAAERRQELRSSLITCAIFALAGVVMGWMWQAGYTQFYLAFDDYPLWYLPVSWAIYAIIHDAFYYWFHRFAHRPRYYKVLHANHHVTLRPSIWGSFAFHPNESLVQAAILPLLLMFIPIHPVVLLVHLTFMTITAVSNHAGHELLPRGRFGRWLSGWLISGAHHTLHHRFGRSNYGLFFTWWDRWLGTEHSRFPEERRRLFQTSQNESESADPAAKIQIFHR